VENEMTDHARRRNGNEERNNVAENKWNGICFDQLKCSLQNLPFFILVV